MNNKIIEKIGIPACLEQLAEECSELSQAALKLARIQRKENPTPVTYTQALENLQEEMADMRLCIDLLADFLNLYNIGAIELEKKQRWIDRIC